MNSFDYISGEEAKRLLASRINNDVIVFGLSPDKSLLFKTVAVFAESDYDNLIKVGVCSHFHYGDRPGCGVQLLFKVVVSDDGRDIGMSTHFEIELKK